MKTRRLSAAFTVSIFFIAVVVCAAQAQFPDTLAARQFTAWLDAFNSGNRSVLLQFLQTYRPSSVAHINDEMGFREQTGGFDYKKTEESTATHFTGIVKERRSDQFARFVIDVEAAEPHRITNFNLLAIPTPAEFAIPRISQDAALAALHSELEKAAASDLFSGTVLIAKDGKPIFTAAYGLADREKKIPNELDTRFRIGSMNKMFTAVAVLQLVQAGKIKLNDPLGKYLTDYPNSGVATKVTIHHLVDAHRRHRRFLQAAIRRASPGNSHLAGLRQAIRQPRS